MLGRRWLLRACGYTIESHACGPAIGVLPVCAATRSVDDAAGVGPGARKDSIPRLDVVDRPGLGSPGE